MTRGRARPRATHGRATGGVGGGRRGSKGRGRGATRRLAGVARKRSAPRLGQHRARHPLSAMPCLRTAACCLGHTLVGVGDLRSLGGWRQNARALGGSSAGTSCWAHEPRVCVCGGSVFTPGNGSRHPSKVPVRSGEQVGERGGRGWGAPRARTEGSSKEHSTQEETVAREGRGWGSKSTRRESRDRRA